MVKSRILPACGIAAATFGCVLFCRESRMLFFAALALCSVYELRHALKQKNIYFLYTVPVAYILGQLALVWTDCGAVWYAAWFGLLVFACLFKAILHPETGMQNAAWTAFGMAWPFFFYGVIILIASGEKADIILTLGILSTWGCDSAALFAGRALGRHKLAPTVSPNKTWEGAIGGAVFSLAAGALLCLILRRAGGPDMLCCVVTAFVASCFGQIGDLAASLLKRYCGVKDYSRVMGEHGGVMDKMDSMLFSLPVTWLCVHLFGFV